jgi:ankyrin repeat protein
MVGILIYPILWRSHHCKILLNCLNVINSKMTRFLAARKGHFDCVVRLLDLGAHINARNRHGMTALHAAADMGHLKIVKLLAERRCDLDIQDDDGRTSLHWAIWSSSVDVVVFLSETGANLRVKDVNGFEPLHTAVHCNNPNIVRLLLTYEHTKDILTGDKYIILDSDTRANLCPVDMCAFKGYIECLEVLLEFNASLTRKGEHRQQPFRKICFSDTEIIFRSLTLLRVSQTLQH